MLKAIIIDDEPSGTNYLSGLIQKHTPQIELIETASNIEDGLALILKKKPDIVFLDIELHSSTGFNLLCQIDIINFQVIFTTAHEHYALKAIKFAALDFLLKPIDEDELKNAVKKAMAEYQAKSFQTTMRVFIDNLKNKPEHKKIAISTSTGMNVIDINNIYYMESDGPYTKFYIKESPPILSSKHLKEYEDLLTDLGFYRVHRSYLVNLSEVKQYIKSDGGYIIVSNGDRVDIADKRKTELLNRLSEQVLFVR